MKTDKILHDSSYSRLDAAKFVDPILCTVLDTRKKKWLIVDGLHRANALTHLCDNVFAHMPTITIVECNGYHLHKKCDAMKVDILMQTWNKVLRIVFSHVTAEKANSGERVTVDKKSISKNDIQGSEENHSFDQRSTATKDTIF
jgi:hypothetical protein